MAAPKDGSACPPTMSCAEWKSPLKTRRLRSWAIRWQARRNCAYRGVRDMMHGTTGILISVSGMAAASLVAATGAVPYTWKNVQIVGGGFVDGIVFHPAAKGVGFSGPGRRRARRSAQK